MPSEHPSFDLIEEPWIACLLRTGKPEELSLRAIFHRADEVRTITGEGPQQTFALLRLLLAILYRALDEDYETPEDWEPLWRDGLPLERIDAYLDRHRSRFDLLHPTHPFLQVADLRTGKGEFKDASPLVFDLPSNAKMFTTRSGSRAASLGYAEAARSLVARLAFDTSGIKSGAVGDERVKGGRGYPLGVAWAGQLGGVFAEGTTLDETLLLNLVAPELLFRNAPDDDLPPWERDPLGPGVDDRTVTRPTGPVDLYTWSARRIRLIAEDGRITGSLIGYGDVLTPQNRHYQEPLSAWRFSRPQAQKLKLDTVYMPREHSPERAIWRGISALVVRREAKEGAQAAATLPPVLVTWLQRLRDDDMIAADQAVRLRAIGVVYGSQQSVVEDVLDDSMSVAVAVLREDDTLLAVTAETAVTRAEEGVRALATLAGNLAVAAGGTADGPRDRAMEEGYAALDAPFRRWLTTLKPGIDTEAADEEWDAEARRTIEALGWEYISRAGERAWRGRDVARVRLADDRDLRLNTARAEAYFRAALARTFGSVTKKSVTKKSETKKEIPA